MSSSCDNFYIYQQRTSNDDVVSEDIEIKRKDQEFRSQKEVMNMMLETWKADSQLIFLSHQEAIDWIWATKRAM